MKTLVLGEDIGPRDQIVDSHGHKFDYALVQIGDPRILKLYPQTYADYLKLFLNLVDEMEILLVEGYEIEPNSQESSWLDRARKAMEQWRMIMVYDEF